MAIRPPRSHGALIASYLEGRDDNTLVEVVVLDATLSESHSQAVEWTSNPIDGGANVTDHGVLQQRTLSISGVVTATPLAGNPAFTDDPLADAERALFAILESKNPCQVTTGLRFFEELYMQSCDVSRDQNTGQAANVSLAFVALNRVQAILVDVPPDLIPKGRPAESKKPQADPEVDAGTQTGEQKTEAEVAGTTNADEEASGATSADKSYAAQGVDRLKEAASQTLDALGA